MSSHWNSPANWWAPRDSERVENGRCEGLARQGLLAGTKIFHRRLYVSFEKIRLALSNGIRYLFWYLYLYWCWNSSRWLWTKNKDIIYNIYGHRRPPEPPNIGSKRWPFIIGKGAVRAIVANCKICLSFFENACPARNLPYILKNIEKSKEQYCRSLRKNSVEKMQNQKRRKKETVSGRVSPESCCVCCCLFLFSLLFVGFLRILAVSHLSFHGMFSRISGMLFVLIYNYVFCFLDVVLFTFVENKNKMKWTVIATHLHILQIIFK